jgi:predicted site-specific integrase-resolvase
MRYSLAIKLSQWAKAQGISYTTAWRMSKRGQLPVPAEQMLTGTVIVHAQAPKATGVARYSGLNPAKHHNLTWLRIGP